jgi:hypothetical protein
VVLARRVCSLGYVIPFDWMEDADRLKPTFHLRLMVCRASTVGVTQRLSTEWL